MEQEIKIESGIPIPGVTRKRTSLYEGLPWKQLKRGDSFELRINGAYTYSGVASYVHKLNMQANRAEAEGNKRVKRYLIRTTAGQHPKPLAVRIWRVR